MADPKKTKPATSNPPAQPVTDEEMQASTTTAAVPATTGTSVESLGSGTGIDSSAALMAEAAANMQLFSAYDCQKTTVALGGLLDWLRFLKPENLAAIKRLIPALDAFVKATELKAQVRAALDVMTIITEMTPNATDDKLLAMLRAVATDQVMDVLVGLIRGFMPDGVQDIRAVEQVATDRRIVASMNIPWQFLVQVALQIYEVLNRFKKS